MTEVEQRTIKRTGKQSVRYALWISLATGIGYLPFALTISVLPGYVTGRLHGGPAEVGWVISSYALTSLLFRPVSGALMNRLGARVLTVGGAVLTMLATVGCAWAGSITLLVLLRLLVGMGIGVMQTATGIWPVQLVAEDRQNWALGLGGTANYLALGLGAPLGTLVARLVGTGNAFVVAGLITLLVVPIACYVPEVRVPRKREQPGARRGRTLLGIALPSVALVFTALGFAAVTSFVVAKYDQIGVSGGAAVVTAYSLTVVVLRIASTWIRWEVTRPTTLAALFMVEAAGIALIGMSNSLALGVIGGVLTGVGMWQIYPTLGVLVVRSVSEAQRPAALSIFGACFTVGVAVGSGSLGVVAQVFGYEVMFDVCAACVLVGLLVAITASRMAAPAAGQRLGP